VDFRWQFGGKIKPYLAGTFRFRRKVHRPKQRRHGQCARIVRDITLDKTFTVLEPSGVDHAFWGNCSSPWTNGGFSWDIPGQWWIGCEKTNLMQNHWSQTFSIDVSGTMTVEKFGHTATRNINDFYPTIH